MNIKKKIKYEIKIHRKAKNNIRLVKYALMRTDYCRLWTPATPKESQMHSRLFKKEYLRSLFEDLQVISVRIPSLSSALLEFITRSTHH